MFRFPFTYLTFRISQEHLWEKILSWYGTSQPDAEAANNGGGIVGSIAIRGWKLVAPVLRDEVNYIRLCLVPVRITIRWIATEIVFKIELQFGQTHFQV